MVFKTEAIVLYERAFTGADKLYELLTPYYGKLSVIARAAARSNSKLAGHLQPFAHLYVMIGRGRNDHLAGVSTIQNFTALHTSFSDFILASSLVELILRINVPDQAASEEFELLRSALVFMNRPGLYAHRVLVGRVFLWKLLTLAGWRPALEQCAVCRRALMSEDVYFDEEHGFVCGEHKTQDQHIDTELVRFLRSFEHMRTWDELVSYAQAQREQKQWFELSQRYYHHVIHQPIRSTALFSYIGQ